MKNKKHFLIYLIIVFILVSLISIFGLNVYSKKELNKEITALLKKDVTKDNFSTKTKSLFRYGKVEKAIKEYIKNYSDKIKKANDIINDETIKKVLSSSNFENDGPNFEKSLNILEKNKKQFDDTINELNKMTNKETIMEFINKYNLSDKYVNLYKKYMFGKEYKKDIENNKKIINKINELGTKVLNTDITVLKLLKDNPDGWVIKEDSIYFYSNDLMNQYNSLIENLNK